MADIVADWVCPEITQSGLSSGANEQLPGGAYWRRARIMPFNLVSVENPVPDECQIWPQYGIAQSGDPTL